MSSGLKPPTPKYRLRIEISGNSHNEIEQEILYLANGGYLLDSDFHKRDTFRVIGGHKTSTLEHTNPDMTPERYERELRAWVKAKRSVSDLEGE